MRVHIGLLAANLCLDLVELTAPGSIDVIRTFQSTSWRKPSLIALTANLAPE